MHTNRLIVVEKYTHLVLLTGPFSDVTLREANLQKKTYSNCCASIVYELCGLLLCGIVVSGYDALPTNSNQH